jgi:hypothetical protein
MSMLFRIVNNLRFFRPRDADIAYFTMCCEHSRQFRATFKKMKRFFGWLSEKDRRRYAAVEAAKLGHGGVEYIAQVLACDPKTIRQGLRDLEEEEDAAAGRIRKKGVDARS